MELWDAYDRHGNKTGYTIVRGKPIPAGQYHLVVHIWYQNAKGELLVQRRTLTKEWMPGVWAATGGSAVQGEDSQQALVRESEEEMGITPEVGECTRLIRYLTDNCITDVWLVPCEANVAELRLQAEEVSDAKWVSLDEFESWIGKPSAFHQYRYLHMLVRYLRETAQAR